MARSDAFKRLGLGVKLPEYEEEDLNRVPLKPVSESTIEDVPDEMAAEKSGLMETQPKLAELRQEQALQGVPLIGRPSLTEEELPETIEPTPTPPKALKSPEERYSAALQAASKAGPTQADYRAAALERAFSEVGASTPAYLQQMSKTLFHKPDFSGQAAAAKAALERPDYDIKAKEAEQKRLEGVAEGIRKEALLPAELAEKESKSLQTKAKLEELKPAGAEAIAQAEQQLGIKINPNATKAELAKIMGTAATTEIKGRGVPLTGVRKQVLEKQLSAAAGQEISLEGLTEDDAKLLVNAFSQGKDKGMSEYQRLSLALRERGLDVAESRAQQSGERSDRLRNKELNDTVIKVRNEYNKETESTRKALEASKNIEELARSDNWVALAAVGPQLARGIGGDVGALSNRDIERYDVNPALVPKALDFIKKTFTGTVTKATQEEYVTAAKIIQGRLQDRLAKKQDKFRKILTGSKLYQDLQGDEEYANQQLFGGEVYEPSIKAQKSKQEKPASTPPAPKSTKQQKLDEIDRKMKELEEQLKSK